MPRFRGRKPKLKATAAGLWSTPSMAPQILSEIDVETWLEEGHWASVASSNVASIMYDAEKKNLHVSFRNGSSGYYSQVDDWVASEMFGANSMGKFVYFKLRPYFVWIKTY